MEGQGESPLSQDLGDNDEDDQAKDGTERDSVQDEVRIHGRLQEEDGEVEEEERTGLCLHIRLVRSEWLNCRPGGPGLTSGC